jgi:MinD-like ATPase involved in chromosome partitioning or flagellar assembly
VAEIDFADGFDTPEPLAWGLTPIQLGTVAAGAVPAYLALHSPLPRLVAVPLALLAVGAGLTLALARREGRTLISWAAPALRFWGRPRRGLLIVLQRPDPSGLDRGPVSGGSRGRNVLDGAEALPEPAEGRSGTPTRPGSGPGEAVDASRRVPLVLLPEPPAAPGERGAEGIPVGIHPLAILGVADAALLEVPVRGAGPEVAGGSGSPRAGDPGWVGTGPPPAPRITRRLTFFSLSGGAGRTTLAVEVAGLLAGQPHRGNAWGMLVPPRVALVDLDLASPRAGLRLGVPAPTEWGLAEGGPVAPEVVRLLSIHRSGLLVLPGPARLLPAGCSDRTDMVHRLAAAVDELESRGCDTVVLDVAGDLSALTRWALQSAHDIFVVLTPTAGGVHDAYRSTEALRRLGLRHRLRYVVNRGSGIPALAEALLDLGGTVVAEVPDDPELGRAEMDHRLLGLEGSGPTAAALRALAAIVDPRFSASGRVTPTSTARRLLRRRAG